MTQIDKDIAQPGEDNKNVGQRSPTRILSVDIGGSNVKILAAGQTEPRSIPSGKTLTPGQMVDGVRRLSKGWEYEAVSIGYPGRVGPHGPSSEPGNLGSGWVGFDLSAAFACPVRVINDAAMQALGSYEGGRMLFLGLGTGLGSALIVEKVIITLELGQIPYRKGGNLGETLGRQGLKRIGRIAWRRAVEETVPVLMNAFLAEEIVLGGGNAKLFKEPPPGCRLGHNLTAFRGGFRLWGIDEVLTLSSDEGHLYREQTPAQWKLI
jgi:polyphosphate glucokinase